MRSKITLQLAKKAMIDANIKTIRDKKEKILATLKHLGKDEEVRFFMDIHENTVG